MKLLPLLYLFLACFIPEISWSESGAMNFASDGFPTGAGTPEGVATDFVRANISGDVALFKSSVLIHCCARVKEKAVKYDNLFREMTVGISDTSHPRNPKQILAVYAARRTNAGSKESYLYAVDDTLDDWRDMMFVDVLARLNDGKEFTNRTAVIQLKDEQWRVHIFPALSPLLRRINAESESTTKVVPAVRGEQAREPHRP